VETDIDILLSRASEASGGLTDAGDPSWREGLEVLLDSLVGDAELNGIGEAASEQTVVSHLTNRLKITDWHSRHPELADSPVEAPIFLIGLPRTGTTALSHLLSADPANRSLLAWEAGDSTPPPTTEGYRTDPRFVAAMEAPNMMELVNPGFKAIHFDPPDMPIECAVVLAQHFTSLIYPTIYNVEGYREWLFAADHTPAYRYHRQMLQVLQSECPGQWQLKSPIHLVDPWALAATYPDARYVITHRDPVKVTASVLSLVRSLTGTFTDHDFTDYIAATWPTTIATLLERQSAFRDDLVAADRADAFVDVAYADLVADPVGTVGSIYGDLGSTLGTEAEAAMRAHAATHTQGAHGRHTYSLDDFGVDGGSLAERFDDYTTRYAEFIEFER
jgi:hypothetical protein